MADFKLVNGNDRDVVYAYKTDYDDLSLIFNKELKSVDISYRRFVFKDNLLEPQWKAETDEWLKHSCKYGHWQSETIVCLSADDIDFINKKCKELFSQCSEKEKRKGKNEHRKKGNCQSLYNLWKRI